MEERKNRLIYIDYIRLLVIVLVVMQHLAVTYTGMGGWYYKEGAPLDLLTQGTFGFYQSLTQGFFMGLLFLLAGYFVPAAYDKKGFGKFIRDRLVRLGIPALIYMLAIHPLIVCYLLGYGVQQGFWSFYAGYIASLDVLGGSGPMWFVIALLLFTVIYGVVRLLVPARPAKTEMKPTAKSLWMLILIIAVCAFLIRIVQPVGTSVFNMQICYFAQYIVLFIAGILAFRHNLFAKIPYKAGKKWLIFGVVFGFVSWAFLMIFGGALENQGPLNGGVTWQSAGFSMWESFVAVAVGVGLIAVFREKCSRENRFFKTLSDNSFAVYMFHPPIIIAAALLFAPVELPIAAKFAVMCAVCLPLCFLAAHYIIRRIPLLKKVM